MKTSWLKIVAFANMANAYLNRHTKQTRFTYALNRAVKQIQKINADIDEKTEEIEIDHCVVEDLNGEKVVVRDKEGRLRFTPDELKIVKKATRELYAREDIEFEPYYATEIPSNLTIIERDAFQDFVIKEALEEPPPAEGQNGSKSPAALARSGAE